MDDGLVFDTDAATADIIRDDDDYSGVRITLTATLASAKLSLHIDVNIGDPRWPTPAPCTCPNCSAGRYPGRLPAVHGVRGEDPTALQRGTVNTRWRDFADIYILTGRHATEETELQRALAEVAAYRHVELSPLADALDGLRHPRPGPLGSLAAQATSRRPGTVVVRESPQRGHRVRRSRAPDGRRNARMGSPLATMALRRYLEPGEPANPRELRTHKRRRLARRLGLLGQGCPRTGCPRRPGGCAPGCRR